MNFAIYRLADGLVTQLHTCSGTPEPGLGYGVLECDPSVGLTSHRVVDGALVAYTGPQSVSLASRPGWGWDWNASSCSWTDGRPLEQAKAQARDRLKAARAVAEMSPFTWNGHSFDGDADGQRRISGAVQMATLAKSLSQPYSVTWTLADNTTLTMSADDVIAAGVSLVTAIESLWDRYRAACAAVEAAANNSQADGVML